MPFILVRQCVDCSDNSHGPAPVLQIALGVIAGFVALSVLVAICRCTRQRVRRPSSGVRLAQTGSLTTVADTNILMTPMPAPIYSHQHLHLHSSLPALSNPLSPTPFDPPPAYEPRHRV
ncbi:hypothetical protein BD309DRAFT_620291 [Dichomitus squalens]|nr:hypothetical protein BD309DRAFT_620291 [Dichomitus squalens]